jgi:hypothetical protein
MSRRGMSHLAVIVVTCLLSAIIINSPLIYFAAKDWLP